MQKTAKSSTIGVIIGLLLAISFSVLAFSEPAQAPPGGNVSSPINVSGTSQTKSGDLIVRDIYARNLFSGAGGTEGNLSNLNSLIGYNDLFLKGNASETAPVYIAGSEIKMLTNPGTGGQERLTISSSGNVGIGTPPTTTEKLVVSGIIQSTGGGFKFPDGTVQTTAALGGGGGGVWATSGANIYNTNTGNVGIGTTNPENRLHIQGGQTWGTGIDLDARDVTGGKKWLIASTGGNAGQGQGKLVFYDNSGTYSAMTIQGAGAGAGHVGIGTTNPTGRLDIIASYDWPTPTLAVRGAIAHPNIQLKSDNGGKDWRFISCGSGCGPQGALRIFDNSGGGDRMVIMPDGNVGIGTTQPGFKLTVAGKIYSSVGVDGESLCIKGDCKSSWSQVGGSGGFGGMYTMLSHSGGAPFCSISNPKTGGCSCPASAPNSTFVHRSYGPCSEWTCSGGTRFIWDLYMCWQ